MDCPVSLTTALHFHRDGNRHHDPGGLSIIRTPKDIFPNINIPVVSVLWNYYGLSPEQMANRIAVINERSLTLTVNDIEHIESESLNGIAVIKIFFQPGANIATALSQVTAMCQTQLRQLPPGTTPPLIIQYSASTVPILQIGTFRARAFRAAVV